MEATAISSPALYPEAAAALLREGDAAHARCKKLVPPCWAAVLKAEREVCWAAKPMIERHVQRSPNAWQTALREETLDQVQRRAAWANAKLKEVPCCDGCGQPAMQLKWCACRLKRYCSKDCQKRDYPAHKAECKKARGVA